MHDLTIGILEKTPEEIEKKLQIIKPFAHNIHIDVIDGIFAESVSCLETEFFNKYKDDFFMEVHLMVDNPTAYLNKYASVGFKRFLGHIEKMHDLEEFVARGQMLGEVGLALDIDTNIDSIKIPYDDLDTILLMSVKAGKSGQSFMPEVLEKIKKIKETSNISIEIDGGINDETLKKAKDEGASRFVTTSYVFNSTDPMQSFEKLTALI